MPLAAVPASQPAALNPLPPALSVDRLLVAQAKNRGLGIISADPMFDAYGVKRVW
jgi:PIN domain nuclease of toxin-antitoxin system